MLQKFLQVHEELELKESGLRRTTHGYTTQNMYPIYQQLNRRGSVKNVWYF